MATASRPTNIDYVKTYFQIPNLTKIHGEPTFKTLRVLFNELKANAGDVSTTLGGGLLGYLGLLLSILEYARVAPGTPFVCSPNRGPLVILEGTAQHAATQMREDHAEALRQHRECIDVEAALKKQALAAIDPKYTKCLRNRSTQQVSAPLDVMMTTLFVVTNSSRNNNWMSSKVR